MKKKVIFLIIGIILLALAGHWGYRMWYLDQHIFIGDTVYPKDSQSLDLRGTHISLEHYEALREQLPDCEILWELPFQGQYLPMDTSELTVSELTEEDKALLAYLPALKTIHAEDCRDYPLLMALQETYTVTYQIDLGGEAYPNDTAALSFSDADPEELLEKLQYLPQLKTVHFVQPDFPAEDLLTLRQTYPQVAFTWEKDVFGITYPDTVTEFDFSGMELTGVEEVEALMAYFPDLQKVIMCDCGIDNETMAAFRERARDLYKVVWSVKISTLTIRTDETTFMPVKHNISLFNVHTHDLVYCEDMIVVDVGHMGIWDLDWLYGMPKLQFLILADTGVSDITPVGSLKELIYLELFKSPGVTDYSPIVGCTALQDLNVAYTNGDAAVFAAMPWLDNLWVNCTNISDSARQLLTETLTDTVIEFDAGWHMGNGWRDLENYYVMRDLLEMPYYNWGAKEFMGN